MKPLDFVDTISWDQLQHAYGTASDIPPLLKRVAVAKGRKQQEELGELWSRVLHQGSIHSASAPVTRALIEMLESTAAAERAALYQLLSGFADSAREALSAGDAKAGCCGGDPRDGEAIRREVLAGSRRFRRDLADADSGIRRDAAQLLTAFPEAERRDTQLVEERYTVESEDEVRRALLVGLIRTRSKEPDWSVFLASALERETAAGNRFLLRYAEVCMEGARSSTESVDELIMTFVQSCDSLECPSFASGEDPDRFTEAVRLLGEERQSETIRRALASAKGEGLSLLLAQHLLRLVFEDHRTNWGQTSYSTLNADGSKSQPPGIVWMIVRLGGMLLLRRLFPFLRGRRLGRWKRDGVRCIEYWGLEGLGPGIPEKLNSAQKAALETIAGHAPLWRFKTNLWKLFQLPESGEELGTFVTARAG